MDQPIAESINVQEAGDIFAGMMDDDERLPGETVADDDAAPAASEEEADDDAGQEDAEEAEPDKEEQADSEPETAEIETLDDVAEALGITSDELLDKLKGRIKVNGEEQAVTLRELVAGYQKDADYRQKTTELSRQRQEFQQQESLVRQQIDTQHMQLGQIVSMVEQMMIGRIDEAAMARLRQENPAEWSARLQELQQRKALFDGLRQQAAAQWEENQQLMQYQRQEQLAARAQAEMEQLQSKLPEWGEQTATALIRYLNDSGYTPDELNDIYDHRALLIADKARRYDELMAKGQVAKERTKALPKLIKPGKPSAGPVKVEKARLQDARKKLKSTGKVEHAAAFFEQFA